MASAEVSELRRYQWFVIRVRTGKEKTVEGCLKRIGYAIFNPTRRATRFANGWARKRRQKTPYRAPVFAGYMFIGLNDLTPSWVKLFDLIFVYSVLGRGGLPEPVNPEALAVLINRFNGGEFDAPEHHRDMVTGREYNVGDTVVTDDGLIEAKVQEIIVEEGGTMVKLEVGIFGRDTPLTISGDRLFKAA